MRSILIFHKENVTCTTSPQHGHNNPSHEGRPRVELEEPAQPWLEAAGLEEAGDNRGEARVLKKPTKVSRSDSKERNQNKEKPSQKLHQKTH
jgi:hypothetical protein